MDELASINSMIEFRKKFLDGRVSEIYVELDPNMPRYYDLESQESSDIWTAIGQLEIETTDASPNKVLFQTRYEEGTQKLFISHDGNHIPEEEIGLMNQKLSRIADKELEWTIWRHGNMIAAQKLQKYGERIHLENLHDNEYCVRTTVEIPTKSL